jgi:molybdate transport repressor ModE-like protein
MCCALTVHAYGQASCVSFMLAEGSTMPTARSKHTIRRTVDYRVDPFDLHLFSAVLEHGTITAAAQASSLSLAAASARLKALEAVVGTPLLGRSKAGASPTDAGKALARHARRVLAELEALHVEMAGFGRGLRGTVRLLSITAALAEPLPPRLGRFLVQHPDIDLDVQELPSDAIMDGLHRGLGDVGVVSDYVDTRGLMAWPWADDQLVALLPRGWLGRAPGAVRFAELLEKPFVGLPADAGLSRYLAVQASRCGRVPHHRVRLGQFAAIARLVADGVGAAVMPLSAAQRWRVAPAVVVPLADAWSRRRLLLCATPQAMELAGVQALWATLRAS